MNYEFNDKRQLLHYNCVIGVIPEGKNALHEYGVHPQARKPVLKTRKSQQTLCFSQPLMRNNPENHNYAGNDLIHMGIVCVSKEDKTGAGKNN